MPGRRVVVTGMAAVTPLGCDSGSLLDDLCAGRSGIGKIESFDTSLLKTRFAGECRDFVPTTVLDPRECKRLDRFAQFALYASEFAVRDAGIAFANEDPYRCGVIIGSGVGGLDQLTGSIETVVHNPSRLSPMLIPRLIINSASGHVSIRHGLRGPNRCIVAACASASNAIGDACQSIRRGEADVMITGGSEAAVNPLCIGGFCAMRALSRYTGSPAGASRPFSKDRDGFVLSEGAGIVVLEEYEHARARGARIYAEMLGFGSTSDAVHFTAPDPEGHGAANSMRLALADAQLPPTAVEYVNAHATSTPLGDLAETVAMKRIFRDHARQLRISSTKSQLGHLLGASGGVEFIITALALYRGLLPPTINLHEPDPQCDLDYIPLIARDVPIRYAMSNNSGFGGHNASIVLGALDGEAARARHAA